MTDVALYLMWISGGLFVLFLVAIICSWIIQHYSDLMKNKLKRQLEQFVSSYFEEEDDRKQLIAEQLNAFAQNSTRKKELLITTIINYGDDFILTNHDMLLNFYEITGLKAYLLNKLHSKSVYMKSLACRYIGDLRITNMEQYIVELISSNNNDVIYNVMLALSKLGDRKGLVHILANNSGNIQISYRAIIEIISVFNGSKEELIKNTIELSDDYIKGILIKAAADYIIENLRELYITYLDSDDKNLRIASIRALSALKAQDNEQFIINKLEDQDWEVRATAAKSLEKLGTSNSFTALGKTTGDSEWWVRQNAANSLIVIPGGKEYASKIINGDDRYAREAVISVIEKM